MIQRLTILISLCLLPLPTPAADQDSISVLSGPHYFQTLNSAITNAVESIDIQMYFIIADPANPDDPVSILLDSLCAASDRGVSVRVVLEDSRFKENYTAYRRLILHGINVQFDTPARLLHSKVIVIDHSICVVGSTNWSRAAFNDNRETAVIFNSPQVARKLLTASLQIPLSSNIPARQSKVQGIPIPANILLTGNPCSLMVSDRANNAFQMYLLFLRQAHASNTNVVPFNIPELRTELNCSNVRRPRLRLQERYNLISYDSQRKQVTILNMPASPDNSFTLPFEFWEYRLHQRLSLRAAFMYLVSLKEAAASTRTPCWFRSQKDLAELYGISDYTVSLGLQELERLNILEIYRAEALQPCLHAERKANTYCMNVLMSPAAFQDAINALTARHGNRNVARARKLADQLNEPNDIDVIRTFLQLIDQYGYDAVRKMNDITLTLKKGSGRRDIENTVQLLK